MCRDRRGSSPLCGIRLRRLRPGRTPHHHRHGMNELGCALIIRISIVESYHRKCDSNSSESSKYSRPWPQTTHPPATLEDTSFHFFGFKCKTRGCGFTPSFAGLRSEGKKTSTCDDLDNRLRIVVTPTCLRSTSVKGCARRFMISLNSPMRGRQPPSAYARIHVRSSCRVRLPRSRVPRSRRCIFVYSCSLSWPLSEQLAVHICCGTRV